MHLIDRFGTRIDFRGPLKEAGPLPAFFYFALSGVDSLTLHPYSRPAEILSSFPIRIFSFTIPGHEEGLSRFHAMSFWASQIEMQNDVFESFFQKIVDSFQWLVDEKWIDIEKVAAGGLSRGAFIAAHFAARVKAIQTVLGFAPLTKLSALQEFKDKDMETINRASMWDLEHLIDQLFHLKNLRFYIGNDDHRVETDYCYQFIRSFARTAHARRLRHLNLECFIKNSIGHKGHGTSPQTFEEGTLWILKEISNA